ncbi:HNH endonuclease [Sulfitobacter phage phiGT1]|nr:HNH endonuclease [Sulfitobacter phage phiGT1]
MRKTRAERFSEKYEINESGCWIWTAAKDQSGYGHFGVGAAKSRKAHRVSYEIYVGVIPRGLQVCHKCDTPSCVNPNHLFLGSLQDNMDDRAAKDRTARGEKNGKAVITAEIAEYIRNSKMSERAIAREIGVHRGTVNAVRSGRTWKKVN